MLGLEPVGGGPDGRGPDGASAQVRPVQQTTAHATAANAVTATLAQAPASQDVLVVVGGAEKAPLTSIVGGGVASWNRASYSTVYENVEIWYGVTAGTDPLITIRCEEGCATGPMWMAVSEWSGVSAASPFEVGTGSAGTGASASPGAIQTLAAPDLLVFAVSDTTDIGLTPMPAGWSPLAQVSFGSIVQRQWYAIAPTPGSYTAAVDATSSWDAAIAAFELAP